MTQSTQGTTYANRLRGAIYAKYQTMTDFARDINWTPQRLSRYLHGKVAPSIEECNAMAEALELSDSDIVRIFFDR